MAHLEREIDSRQDGDRRHSGRRHHRGERCNETRPRQRQANRPMYANSSRRRAGGYCVNVHNKRRKVLLVDYGMGNIQSLGRAVEHLGHDVMVGGHPREISAAQVVILPGVGSFPAAMRVISNQDLGESLREAASSGRTKILGICLGMQLLMDSSDEEQEARGLGLVGGSVERFRFPNEVSLPLPHIGFNTVSARDYSILFDGLRKDTDFYFVHSYRTVTATKGAAVATCHYGETFVAAIESGNIYGTQFHPEKSQSNGLRLLSNFLAAEIR